MDDAKFIVMVAIAIVIFMTAMTVPALLEENNSNNKIIQCVEAGGTPAECDEAIR